MAKKPARRRAWGHRPSQRNCDAEDSGSGGSGGGQGGYGSQGGCEEPGGGGNWGKTGYGNCEREREPSGDGLAGKNCGLEGATTGLYGREVRAGYFGVNRYSV
jgi:hypothetical protein